MVNSGHHNNKKSTASNESNSVHELFPVVYDELRSLAHRWTQKRQGDEILQPTALVHEAYLHLLKNPKLNWESQTHFFAIAATAMRNIIHDHVRSQSSQKRGGQWNRVTFHEANYHGHESCEFDAFELTEAIAKLEGLNKRHCSIVEMRLFGGLEFDAIAETLGVSTRTVERDWRSARVWLKMQIDGSESS